MHQEPKYWAVVPAAGAGKRMAAESPKQYLDIGQRTVIEHTLDALLSCKRINAVVVVIAANDEHWPGIQAHYRNRPVDTVVGGAERYHSVLNGLDHLTEMASDDDWVLVHDAARPCLRSRDIDYLIDTIGDDAAGGLLGVPVADTMKQVNDELCVEQTVTRDGLWHALTPQMFRLGQLREAMIMALAGGELMTDEAVAMELAGHRPRMVQGHRDNIKITMPADLELAEFYLRMRES
jgi:2-C-methyl-D-erythritol 4-phosphate cytidylyltransferase